MPRLAELLQVSCQQVECRDRNHIYLIGRRFFFRYAERVRGRDNDLAPGQRCAGIGRQQDGALLGQ